MAGTEFIVFPLNYMSFYLDRQVDKLKGTHNTFKSSTQ